MGVLGASRGWLLHGIQEKLFYAPIYSSTYGNNKKELQEKKEETKEAHIQEYGVILMGRLGVFACIAWTSSWALLRRLGIRLLDVLMHTA